MCCSHLSLSLLVVAGSRSHLLEISTHMNSIDVRKKQGGEGGGPPPKFYISTHSLLSTKWLKLLHGVVFLVLALLKKRREGKWGWGCPHNKFYTTVTYEMI